MIYKWVRSVICVAVLLQIVKAILPENRLYKSVSVVLSFVFLFTTATFFGNLKFDSIDLNNSQLNYEYIDYVKEISDGKIKGKIHEFCQSEGIESKDCQIEYSGSGVAVKNVVIFFEDRLLIEDERNINKIEIIVEKTSEYLNVGKEVVIVKYV